MIKMKFIHTFLLVYENRCLYAEIFDFNIYLVQHI